MPYPSGEPAWQTQILDQLAQSNQLSGVNPVILGAIAQEESGFENAGAGFNDAGYGGYFGLGLGTYPGGLSVPKSELLTNSPSSFNDQAIVAADAFNSYLQQAHGNVLDAESIFQSGKPGQRGSAEDLISQALGGASAGGGGSPGTPSGSGGSGASGGSGGGSGGSSGGASGAQLTGPGAILQTIDHALNPSGGSLLTQITTLGTSDIAATAQSLVMRGLFAIAFGAIFAVGLHTFITKSNIDLPSLPNPFEGPSATEQQQASRERIAQTKQVTETIKVQGAHQRGVERARQGRLSRGHATKLDKGKTARAQIRAGAASGVGEVASSGAVEAAAIL